MKGSFRDECVVRSARWRRRSTCVHARSPSPRPRRLPTPSLPSPPHASCPPPPPPPPCGCGDGRAAGRLAAGPPAAHIRPACVASHAPCRGPGRSGPRFPRTTKADCGPCRSPGAFASAAGPGSWMRPAAARQSVRARARGGHLRPPPFPLAACDDDPLSCRRTPHRPEVRPPPSLAPPASAPPPAWSSIAESVRPRAPRRPPAQCRGAMPPARPALAERNAAVRCRRRSPLGGQARAAAADGRRGAWQQGRGSVTGREEGTV
jgi:hypothetical protein